MRISGSLETTILALTASLLGCTLEEEVGNIEQLGEPTELRPEVSSTSGGLTLNNAQKMPNGINLPNGHVLPNAQKLVNGLNLGNGIHSLNGINLSNNAVLDGVVGPYLAPASGSDLEKWLDSNVDNNTRIVRYLIECALPAGKNARLKYRGVTATYMGVTGLGPSIQAGLMTVDDQERVSGCLLARVNYMGMTVKIDMFANEDSMKRFDTLDEFQTYKFPEAAFYGNIFLTTPKAYACGLAYNVSDKRGLRACSKNSSDCGIITVNSYSCDAYCSTGATITFPQGSGWAPTPYKYFSNCNSGGKSWKYPISVMLARLPDGAQCFNDDACGSHYCVSNTCTPMYYY